MPIRQTIRCGRTGAHRDFEETRQNLQDAHQRVMAVAAVQEHLHASEHCDQIEIGPYLSRLCESLAASMIGDSRPIAPQVLVNGGTAVSAKAVSLGLIVTFRGLFSRLEIGHTFIGSDGNMISKSCGSGSLPSHLS